jgi:multidrug resistance efflux pump
VTSGDLVKAGDVLLELDVRELRQQDAELQAEIRRIEAEVGKYRASESLSEMEIAQARLDQSLARRDRVAQYIAQSTALAPFDGVVVEGERKELLGAPVRKGEMLLRVAKVEDLYVTLLVAERDVRDVRPDAIGELLLLSHPDVAIAIQVTAIIPVAQLKGQEGNHFMVRAKLLQQPEPWWRPGMTGLGRIDVGERRVIWILTHKLIDNLRLMFWW